MYIARNDSGRMVEFVESIQPPFNIREKWVLIVSTLFGCPVDCSFCDAGGNYKGRLAKEEILFQIEYPVLKRFPDRFIDSEKFKIQFSRMGEPSFNHAVLDVLEELPDHFKWKTFIPSLSTIAPIGTNRFFDRLGEIKHRLYPESFQLQFSLHSTSVKQRDEWLPVKKWSFSQIAEYGKHFYQPEGKKITLNFAVAENSIIEAKELRKHFSPDIFLVKLTPVNPTYKADANKIRSGIDGDGDRSRDLIRSLSDEGFEVVLSIGEMEENRIGSNCGQYVQRLLHECDKLDDAYDYKLLVNPVIS